MWKFAQHRKVRKIKNSLSQSKRINVRIWRIRLVLKSVKDSHGSSQSVGKRRDELCTNAHSVQHQSQDGDGKMSENKTKEKS